MPQARSPQTPPLVEVIWLDAQSVYDIMLLTRAQALPLARRHSVGYLIHQDDERTIIAGTFDPANGIEQEDAVADITIIPTGWVQMVHPIRRARVRPAAPPSPGPCPPDGPAGDASPTLPA